MRSGPSVTIVRTTASSQRPAPASSVSRTWSSNESSSLVTHAIPPCAQAVFVSGPLRLVITATEPCLAAFKAKLNPAMPLPMTTKSYSFIPTEYCRSTASFQSKPQVRVKSSVSLNRSPAKFPHRPTRHNRSAQAALHQGPFGQDRQRPSPISFQNLLRPATLYAKLRLAFALPDSNRRFANCTLDHPPPAPSERR